MGETGVVKEGGDKVVHDHIKQLIPSSNLNAVLESIHSSSEEHTQVGTELSVLDVGRDTAGVVDGCPKDSEARGDLIKDTDDKLYVCGSWGGLIRVESSLGTFGVLVNRPSDTLDGETCANLRSAREAYSS